MVSRKNLPLLRRRTSRLVMIALAMAGGLVCMGATAHRFEPFKYQDLSDLELQMLQKGFTATGFDTDVAIVGRGYLKVQMPMSLGGGEGFTRFGSLFVNGDHRLAVSAGERIYPLLPAIQLPSGAAQLSISPDGTVQFSRGRMGPMETAGHISLFQFDNPAALSLQQDAICKQTQSSGSAVQCAPGCDSNGYLQSGFLPSENTQPVLEP